MIHIIKGTSLSLSFHDSFQTILPPICPRLTTCDPFYPVEWRAGAASGPRLGSYNNNTGCGHLQSSQWPAGRHETNIGNNTNNSRAVVAAVARRSDHTAQEAVLDTFCSGTMTRMDKDNIFISF